MRRRNFLRSGIVVGTACVAGCMGDNGGTTGETQESEKPKAYRFYFDDQANTLGGAAGQQIPEDAIDQQIVTNDRSEDEWQEMQLNDVKFARFALENRGVLEVDEGSVEEIEQQTIQLYQERKDSNEFQDQHNAEIFTESVLDAVLEVTDVSTGPAQANIVKTVADYIAANNEEVDLQNYKLSEGLSMIGDAGGDRFSHQLGLLQYEENEETHVRYAEIENRFNDPHARPENSIYATPIGEETDWSDTKPSDWVSVFDYEKRRKLQQQGIISDQGATVLWALTHAVDDAALDGTDWENSTKVGKDAKFSEEGIPAIISDSFGQSLESYVKSPGEEFTREDFETTARAVFTILQANGFEGRFALDGDLSSPEVYKTQKKIMKKIRADMAYDEVASMVLA